MQSTPVSYQDMVECERLNFTSLSDLGLSGQTENGYMPRSLSSQESVSFRRFDSLVWICLAQFALAKSNRLLIVEDVYVPAQLMGENGVICTPTLFGEGTS